MALHITYFDSYDGITRQCYGTVVGAAVPTLSGSSSDLGVIPSAASVARLEAGEDCYVSNNGVAASSSNGLFLSAGSIVDIAVPRSGQFKGVAA